MGKFKDVNRLPRLEKYAFREQYAEDVRPDKMLVSTGAFKDENGEVPRFECVRIATERVRAQQLSKYYLDIAGYTPFREAVNNYVFADLKGDLNLDRMVTIHTPGGTAALRLGADLIKSQWPNRSIWVSDPTWGNHHLVFQIAGLDVREYSYYDAARKEFDLGHILRSIEAIPVGDVIFLQTSTHNPTCIDPSPDDWEQIARLVTKNGLLPFFDTAFFGFSKGIREDLAGLMAFCRHVEDLLVAFSFSKSFALYNDRIGAFSILGSSHEAALNVYSHARRLIRANYSNPPLDGAAVVTEILNDPELFQMWESDLNYIRQRIQTTRAEIVSGMKSFGVKSDLSNILREKGLFTSFNLTPAQIDEIRDVYAIHISKTRRINVTSMTAKELGRFCQALAKYIP